MNGISRERSLLSGALFYKDIGSYVQQLKYTQAFKDSGLPPSLLAGTGATPDDDFNFSVPVNAPGGKLKGFEINYQQGFTFLPGFLKNFGTQLNYTYADSNLGYLNTSGQVVLVAPLVGLSKHSYNGTLYYDNDVFSARISLAHRDGYLTTVPGRNNNDLEGTKGTSQRRLLGVVEPQPLAEPHVLRDQPHERGQRPVRQFARATARSSTRRPVASTTPACA